MAFATIATPSSMAERFLSTLTRRIVEVIEQRQKRPVVVATGLISAASTDVVLACAGQNHNHRRRATAMPKRKATNSEPSGASRAMLLKTLNGIPGLRPASIVSLILFTVPITASETSAIVDFGSGAGSSQLRQRASAFER